MFNAKLARARRDVLGLTDADVATAVGVSKSSASGWFQGTKQPSMEHLIALRKVLKVPAERLITDGEG